MSELHWSEYFSLVVSGAAISACGATFSTRVHIFQRNILQ